jgi:group I intron endonuclease
MFKIYIITNKVNGKIYIGQTKQSIKKRFTAHKSKAGKIKRPLYNAMEKYGIENFEILEVFSTNSFDEVNNEEKRLILEKNSTNIEIGYNIASGGQDYFELPFIAKTKEHKEKLQKSHRKNAKPIIQFDWKTGETIKIWDSSKEILRAGFSRASIQQLLKKPEGFGYIYESGWAYLSFWNEKEDKNYFADPNATPWNGKRVKCYTKQGDFVKEYKTLREAADDVGLPSPTSIGNCLKGRSKSAGGYLWSWVDEDVVKPYSGGSEKKVLCYNKQMELVREYDSVNSAALDVGVNISTLSSALNGQQKTSAGFIWRFKNE